METYVSLTASLFNLIKMVCDKHYRRKQNKLYQQGLGPFLYKVYFIYFFKNKQPLVFL